ncbi:MAG: inositol monophosphatase family protein [Acidimicrobiales bacterium]
MTDAFDIEPHVEDITRLVESCSRRALDWYRRPMRVDNKHRDGFDPVTEADRAVEDLLRAGLADRFPDHAVVGEERGTTGGGAVTWVIDPIDGTRAFIVGHPQWGTLLGLVIDGRPVAGWMRQPVIDETHLATPSGGARLIAADHVRTLRTRPTTRLGDAIMAATHPEMFAVGDERDRYNRLVPRVRMTRYGGDCANYGLLAEGHLDLVVEAGLAAYDVVALIPIVTGAGGVMTDLDGRPPTGGGFVVAAATPELHAAALEVLRED